MIWPPLPAMGSFTAFAMGISPSWSPPASLPAKGRSHPWYSPTRARPAPAEVTGLVAQHERQQSYAAFRAADALRWRIPIWTSMLVRGVTGAEGRLRGVELAELPNGNTRFVRCETSTIAASFGRSEPDSRPRRRIFASLFALFASSHHFWPF
jgi:hypothetical protein